jgi:hypothetical protein
MNQLLLEKFEVADLWAVLVVQLVDWLILLRELELKSFYQQALIIVFQFYLSLGLICLKLLF